MTVRPLVLLLAAFAAFSLTCAAEASSARQVLVTSAADAGPGSFRWAITRANGDPAVTRIVFTGRPRVVALLTTVTFTGGQALTLDGNGATLDGAAIGSGPAFLATGGGDLAVTGLTVRNAPAEGLTVEVPATATGVVRVWLSGVDILDNKGHGVLVNDQVDSTTTDGVQPTADGSAASVAVAVWNSRFLRNGFSVSDRDGLRVNEGGAGDLWIGARLVTAHGNAADGIEVDERGAGDVRVEVFGARITENGVFDPSDLDDGFDIDEYDEGSVIGTVAFTMASGNYEEGLDFNENNAGDLRVNLWQVDASGNREEGIDYEEDDDFAGGGDLVVLMHGVRASGNGADGGDAGLKIREKGDGLLQVALDGVETRDNLRGGISIREDAIGSLTATITRATSSGNAGHGIDLDENRASTSDAGNLTAVVSKSSSSGNTGAGIRADQQTPGTGALELTHVDLIGNGGGATTGGGVVVTITP